MRHLIAEFIARLSGDGKVWYFWPRGDSTPEQIYQVWERVPASDKLPDLWHEVHQFSDVPIEHPNKTVG